MRAVRNANKPTHKILTQKGEIRVYLTPEPTYNKRDLVVVSTTAPYVSAQPGDILSLRDGYIRTKGGRHIRPDWRLRAL